jgi:hypothetical protein
MVVIVDEGSLQVLGSLKEKNIFQVIYEFPIILRRNKIVCDKRALRYLQSS